MAVILPPQPSDRQMSFLHSRTVNAGFGDLTDHLFFARTVRAFCYLSPRFPKLPSGTGNLPDVPIEQAARRLPDEVISRW